MNNIAVPTNKLLDEFRRELWKDQRGLEVINTEKGQRFVKTFDKPRDVNIEKRVLRIIERDLGDGFVPRVYESDNSSITMDYLKGIRVFNLFVELDHLVALGNSDAAQAKRHLMDRCIKRQKLLQQVLYKNRNSISDSKYPVGEKVKSIISILSEPLLLTVNWKIIEKELELLNEYWKEVSIVPFRDATTKNMVICEPNLWIGSFASEEERRKKIEFDLACDQVDWLESPIIDFDFTSGCDLTTPEDDPISLLLHERTWQGSIFDPKDLVWIDDQEVNSYRAAVTLIIRYFRFGGRKLGYRLLHPRAHCTRFRYDHGEFYFQRLSPLVEKWSTKAVKDFSGLLQFSSIIDSVIVDRLPSVDFFLSIYSEKRRQYYLDMYPD